MMLHGNAPVGSYVICTFVGCTEHKLISGAAVTANCFSLTADDSFQMQITNGKTNHVVKK